VTWKGVRGCRQPRELARAESAQKVLRRFGSGRMNCAGRNFRASQSKQGVGQARGAGRRRYGAVGFANLALSISTLCLHSSILMVIAKAGFTCLIVNGIFTPSTSL
jgi:hypothetical protein